MNILSFPTDKKAGIWVRIERKWWELVGALGVFALPAKQQRPLKKGKHTQG